MSKSMLLAFIIWCINVSANVEKVIFIAPDTQPKPQDTSIDNLLLTPLSESYPAVRTYINASFPTNTSLKGTESWFLLDGLKPRRRYEVRVCWLATQPTSFWLYSHQVDAVFSEPTLISSLSTYSYARHDQLNSNDLELVKNRKAKHDSKQESTFLFLQVFAAADYFSLNQTLMDDVPPVAVDLILDPYVLDILPKSLLPTGLYLGVIGFIAWQASSWILRCLPSSNAVSNRIPSDKSD
ncbi:uncharacterized protein A1O9_09691 [Exophiala aquamarina CBS 119918]|uniref:Uncharacterized protein n=1 Tax=Exophiala aquamarina CBS 119918 TaxID=1182545 RepID=A0A072P334_9EURO|nr:uncharacterized protein A1O9_09691 [Exophiala aquamarina CBS 119918]KEF54524.1 hypothetical protein A1O9_09691 [Exophiala aquamarina CBS 119918]